MYFLLFLATGYHNRSSSNCVRFLSIQSIFGPDMTEIKLKQHTSLIQPKAFVNQAFVTLSLDPTLTWRVIGHGEETDMPLDPPQVIVINRTIN